MKYELNKDEEVMNCPKEPLRSLVDTSYSSKNVAALSPSDEPIIANIPVHDILDTSTKVIII